MPVGTLATVKGLTNEQIINTSSQIILCNNIIFVSDPEWREYIEWVGYINL